jgi:hypothetical protein
MNSSPRLWVILAILICLLVPTIASADSFLYTLSTDYSGIDGLPVGSTVSWQFEVPSLLTATTTITSFMSASLGPGLSSCGGVLDAILFPSGAPSPYSGEVITDFIGSCNGISDVVTYTFGDLNPGVHTARDFPGQIVGTLTIASVPEPSSLMLFGSGVLGLVGVIRRKLRA